MFTRSPLILPFHACDSSASAEQGIKAIGGLSLHSLDDMAVRVERDRDRRVAEPLLHYLRMHPFCE